VFFKSYAFIQLHDNFICRKQADFIIRYTILEHIRRRDVITKAIQKLQAVLRVAANELHVDFALFFDSHEKTRREDIGRDVYGTGLVSHKQQIGAKGGAYHHGFNLIWRKSTLAQIGKKRFQIHTVGWI
jgi:hypothetical protein